MTGPYGFKRFDPGADQDHWDTPPGHWCSWAGGIQTTAGTTPTRFVILCCPVCKQYGTLPHEVDETGRVTPSVVCPHPPCPMHLAPVTLEGWSYGKRASEKE
jgi:hypothetical protein